MIEENLIQSLIFYSVVYYKLIESFILIVQEFSVKYISIWTVTTRTKKQKPSLFLTYPQTSLTSSKLKSEVSLQKTLPKKKNLKLIKKRVLIKIITHLPNNYYYKNPFLKDLHPKNNLLKKSTSIFQIDIKTKIKLSIQPKSPMSTPPKKNTPQTQYIFAP